VARPERLRWRIRRRGEHPVESPPVDLGRTVACAGLECAVEAGEAGALRWSIANDADAPAALDAVALVWDGGPAGPDPRLFANGYQSWSPARTRRLGRDADPGADTRPIPLVRAAFHADPGAPAPGELRSEQVALLADGHEPHTLVGFVGGATHAGTVRVRVVDGRLELAAEAWLGGAELAAGARRALHDVVIDAEADDSHRMLTRWARIVGDTEQARVTAPYLVGWCSWYHYFHDVTEADMRANLARARDWPFDVFQLDDGFQASIGDWLTTNERFPSGLETLADEITGGGATAGIWIAPFLAAPDSALAREHPEFLARAPHGTGRAIGMFHEVWGGVMWELDTTRPDVLAHLEHTAAALVAMGYRYLKLDFTFSAAMPGRYDDATRTPAERVRAGYDAVRRGAGDDAFILGCGAPLGALVGVVDAMRIGADVAPAWDVAPDASTRQPAYEETTPSTRNAFVNTCTRSFMHRTLWANDPDCLMLRTEQTELPAAAAAVWAHTVGCSGGLALVSDDLALLGPAERRLLEETIATGRAADAAATQGEPARAVGLFETAGPVGLEGPAGLVTVDLSVREAPTTVRAVR
jgi:alpha-galactosidase